MDQQFDAQGRLLCAACNALIGRFYVVVSERDDATIHPVQLAVHTSCLPLLDDGLGAS